MIWENKRTVILSDSEGSALRKTAAGTDSSCLGMTMRRRFLLRRNDGTIVNDRTFWGATVLIFICLLSFSFSLKKTKKFIPPGTVQITETFFADETEISNFVWCEYEWSVAAKYGVNSREHISVLPDTLVWRDKLSYNEPYVQYYYRHPAYRDYPVVGVSYEQALAFCKWRTERVKAFWIMRTKKELNIEYRLPTKEEWEKISFCVPGFFNNKGRNEKGKMQLNIISPIDSSITAAHLKNNADVTAPVYSYWKSSFGLWNIFGNVAEMVSEKGICKGGSWRNRLEECRAGKDLPYTKPTAWLGFRCVCVLKL